MEIPLDNFLQQIPCQFSFFYTHFSMLYHSQSTAVLTAQQLPSDWENSVFKLTPQLWGKAHEGKHNTDLHLAPAAPSAFSESTILLPTLGW